MMKLTSILPIIIIFMVGLFGSCTKDQQLNAEEDTSLSSNISTTISADTRSVPSVILGAAGSFAILSKTGITNVPASAITGNVGTSPITGAALLLKCTEVTGKIYTVDADGPLPCRETAPSTLGTAVLNMQAAYTDAAGRAVSTSTPDREYLNLGAGNIGGKTLYPGVYKWTTDLIIPADITIDGSSTDIFIFQVAGTLNMSSGKNFILTGGAKAENIFWVTGGAVTLGTSSHFEGNILSMTAINLQTGASIKGRLLAQTAVTLQMNTVTKPAG
jgi:hypothetical protein